MKKSKIKVILGALFAAFAALLCSATVGMFTTKASAAISDAPLIQVDGAGVRYATHYDALEDGGLRYEIKMESTNYQALKDKYGENITFGVLIAPRDYHEENALNSLSNITGANAVYGWKETEISSSIVAGNVVQQKKSFYVGGDTEILNLQSTAMANGEDGYHHFYASITNIKLKNYTREFVAFGYMKIWNNYMSTNTTNDDGLEVHYETNASYQFAVGESSGVASNIDNVRSIAEIANTLLTSGKYANGVDETVALQRKNVLLKGYLRNSVVTVKFQSNQSLQIGEYTTAGDGSVSYGANSVSGMTMQYNYFSDGANAQTVYIDAAASERGINNFIYNASNTSLHYDVFLKSSNAANFSRYTYVMIFDADGKLVEGRDGVNGGKLVSANEVVRTASDTTTISTHGANDTAHTGATSAYNIASGAARCFDVPAGGFAIIVPHSYAATEGRSIAMANMRYGTYAQIYFGTPSDTSNKTLTNPYTDKAPFVYNATANAVVSEGDLPTYITTVGDAKPTTFIDGWTYIDDNGTFLNDNDVTTTAPTFDASTVNMNVAGCYTETAKLLDGSGNVVDVVNRNVAVLSNSGFALNLSIKDFTYEYTVNDQASTTVQSANFTVNPTGNESVPNPLRIALFTGNQKESAMNITPSNWGVAIVLDKYGYISRVYNGADEKYFDSANTSGVSTVPGTSTAISYTNYADLAFSSLKTGEYMILGNYDATYIQFRGILREASYHINEKFDIWSSVTSAQGAVPFEVLFASKR